VGWSCLPVEKHDLSVNCEVTDGIGEVGCHDLLVEIDQNFDENAFIDDS
jgi:hypothetical protein